MKTYYELVRAGEERLLATGCPEPGADARLLLLHVMGWDLAAYAMHGTDMPASDKEEEYENLIKRRAEREPLQYIQGSAPFFGYDFRVTPDVLIPRFDTEVLVDSVLPLMKHGDAILDMCTGSGCIGITLWLEAGRAGKKVSVTVSDISGAALTVAGENARALGAQIRCVQSDLFQHIDGTYDIITVNPPYIKTDVILTLDREVRCYEPKLALDGMADGLFFYREIAREAKRHIRPGGLLALEIGADQGESVETLLREASYEHVKILRDLGGLDRCVLGYV